MIFMESLLADLVFVSTHPGFQRVKCAQVSPEERGISGQQVIPQKMSSSQIDIIDIKKRLY